MARRISQPETEKSKGKELETGLTDSATKRKNEVHSDDKNFAVLTCLYFLQGVPMGICAILPMLLAEKKISDAEQGLLSLTTWPFSLKLLWAPLVDSFYSPRMGRRKSWLIPTQLCIGFALLYFGSEMDALLGADGTHPEVKTLTAIFFGLFFLCATQDIAVDGWALTMLSEKNRHHASTANTVGQALGNAAGLFGYLGLNAYGLVDMGAFMMFWGVVFVVVTTAVALFKTEKPTDPAHEVSSVGQTYAMMWRILWIPAVVQVVGLILLSKIPFAITEALGTLRLQSRGLPKETVASMAMLLTPLSIVLPGPLSRRYLSGGKPFYLFYACYIPRVALGLVFGYVIYAAPQPFPQGKDALGLYAAIFVVMAVYGVLTNAMFLSQMSFFSKVSDPVVGGTYMTLLNTAANLANMWPRSLSFFVVDKTSTQSCDAQGKCDIISDSYFFWLLVSSVYGFVFFYFAEKTMKAMEKRPKKDWVVPS